MENYVGIEKFINFLGFEAKKVENKWLVFDKEKLVTQFTGIENPNSILLFTEQLNRQFQIKVILG